MVKEIRIRKSALDSISDAVSNALSLFEKELPNERNILRSKLFNLRDLINSTQSLARYTHPEDFGSAQLTLPEAIKEKEEIERMINEITTASKETLIIKQNDLRALLSRLRKVVAMIERLSKVDDEKEDE